MRPRDRSGAALAGCARLSMVERRPLPRRHGNGGGLERRHGGERRRWRLLGDGSSGWVRCSRGRARSFRLQPETAKETEEVQASAAGGGGSIPRPVSVRASVRPARAVLPGPRCAHKASVHTPRSCVCCGVRRRSDPAVSGPAALGLGSCGRVGAPGGTGTAPACTSS